MRQCGTHIPAQTQTRARAHAPEYVHANARRRNHAPAHKHNHSHYYSMDSLRNRITTHQYARTHARAGAELQHGSGALLAPKHIRRELRRVLAQMCVSQPVPAQMSAPERVRYVGAALRRQCAMPLRGLALVGISGPKWDRAYVGMGLGGTCGALGRPGLSGK
jgi:hypothetical protein